MCVDIRGSTFTCNRGSSHSTNKEHTHARVLQPRDPVYASVLHIFVVNHREAETEHLACVTRVDDPVVERPRRRIVHIRRLLHHLRHPRLLHVHHLLCLRDLRRRQRRALLLEALALHDVQDACQLVGAHHAALRARPREHEACGVRPAAHGVVAGAVRRAQHDGEQRRLAVRHCVDQHRALLDQAGLLGVRTDHEARDVLEEDHRLALHGAAVDELRRVRRALRGQHAVVADEPNGEPVDLGEGRHHLLAVLRLEEDETRTVNDARHDLRDVKRLLDVTVEDAQQLLRRVLRRLHGREVALRVRRLLLAVLARDQLAHDEDRLLLALCEEVGHAALQAVHHRAAQMLLRRVLARRHLHQRRTGEEHGGLVPHHDAVVGHARHVSPTGRARSEHSADGGALLVRLLGQVEEPLATLVEHRLLLPQVGASGLRQVDHHQVVLETDLLRTQQLGDDGAVHRPTLDGRDVGAHHHFRPGNQADAAHHRVAAVVLTVPGQRQEVQERASLVEQQVDPFPAGVLAALPVLAERLCAALGAVCGNLLVEILNQCHHCGPVLRKLLIGWIQPRLKDGNHSSTTTKGEQRTLLEDQ
eukprot:Rhum_TRINITY_DN18986_c0_g1::Rhum_TRINITY_DN18986_c0_g1_i1::g.168960::m.168960